MQIRRHWNDGFFDKRRPILILGFIIPLAFFHVGDLIVYFIYLVIYDWRIESIYYVTYSCIFYPSLSMAESIVIMRIWLLYFDSNLSHLLKNQQWQLSINMTIQEEVQRTFFLNPKNQRKWASNGLFLFKIACCFWIVDVIIHSFLYLYLEKYLDSIVVKVASFAVKVTSCSFFVLFCLFAIGKIFFIRFIIIFKNNRC